MAAVTITISYDDSLTAADLVRRLAFDSHARMEAMVALSNEFAAIAGGATRANVSLAVEDGTRMTNIATFGGAALSEGDEVEIAGITFAYATDPVSDDELPIGANADEDAANLAAAINGHPTLSQFAKASSAGPVTTVEPRMPGILGAFIQVSSVTDEPAAIISDITEMPSSAQGSFEAPPRTYELGGQ